MSKNNAEIVGSLFDRAEAAARFHNDHLVHAVAGTLSELDPVAVRDEGQRRVMVLVGAAWNIGWQPVELARHVRRTADATTASLGLVAIAADHARRDASTVDARWATQLGALDLPRITAPASWVAEWARTESAAWRDQVHTLIALVQSLATIAPIAILIPPPGTRPGTERMIDLTSKVDDPMLNRVRALLAQAESTTFEAEAETFTAKAQELMTRHAIDMAMVSTGTRRSETPETIRVPIDEPCVAAKSLLLQLVAESSRCRAVFHPRFAMSSVVGFAADLTATETLFTSLLVQAQIAMLAAATSAPSGTRARSRGFRSAFLTAYAHRVGERLAEINAHVVADAEAETGRSILPVLAARSSVVNAAVDELFGRLRATAARRSVDAAGWASGRAAADRAHLDTRDPAGAPRALH